MVSELFHVESEYDQIVKHLNRHNNLEARVDRVEERSRQVCITTDTICGRCRARIGTKLFVLFPDDSIVCYKVRTDWLILKSFTSRMISISNLLHLEMQVSVPVSCATLPSLNKWRSPLCIILRPDCSPQFLENIKALYWHGCSAHGWSRSILVQ